LRKPGLTGSPTSVATASGEVTKTLHQLIDALSELSAGNAGGTMAHPPRDLPLLLDAAEAANALSLSRAKVVAMASRGEIPSVRIGRSLRIPRDPLLVWIEANTNLGQRPAPRRLPEWAYVDRSAEL
jgi:excisionase family DNA binding protein